MKKIVLLWFLFFTCTVVFGITPLNSFDCIVNTPQTLSKAQISQYVAKLDLENFRLRSKPVALKFDNGFEILLYPATQLQAMGLVNNATDYKEKFDPKFVLPVFHITPDGNVSMAYPVVNSKYSSEKR